MLTDLPEELLEQIFSYFQTITPSPQHEVSTEPFWYHCRCHYREREGRSALRALSRTCKAFWRLVRPLLYEMVPDIDGVNLSLFCETLVVTAPQNAAFVQDLRINHGRHEFTPVKARDERDPHASEFLPGLESSLEESKLSETLRCRLVAGLQQNHDDAKAALILLACRNLTTLTLSSEYMGVSYLIPRLLNELCTLNGRQLKDISFRIDRSEQWRHPWDEYSRGLDRFEWYLPFVETFRLTNAVLWEGRNAFFFENFYMPALRYICLEESIVDELGFSDIFRYCPALQRLRIHYENSSVIDQFAPIYFSIGDTLRTKGRLLEELDFDIRSAMYNEFHDFDPGSPLRSLAELQALRVLRMPLFLLVGPEDQLDCSVSTALMDFLPSSIEHLVIWAWPDSLEPVGSLSDLMLSLQFQNLSTIRLPDTYQRGPLQVAPAGWTYRQQWTRRGATLRRVR